MKKAVNISKKMIALIVAGVVFVAAGIVAICTYLNKKGEADGYQIELYTNSETGEEQITSIDLYANVTEGGRFRVDEVWVQLANLQDSELNVYVSKGTETDEQATGSSTKLLEKKTITKRDIRKGDGWVLVYKGDGFPTSSRPQIKLGFDARVVVEEIVILDTNSKLPALKATGVSRGPIPETSGTSWSKIDSEKADSNSSLVKDLQKVVDGKTTCPHITVKEN